LVEKRRILDLRRRSKYLLIDVEGDSTLVIHLGMSGRLTVTPADRRRQPHEHVGFRLEGGERLRFRDPRRFGLALALPTAGLADDPHFAGLGREPLDPPLTGPQLAAIARGLKAPVKAFLMDASRLVGVGNIYASEALHRAGIHPRRSVGRISAAGWERLAAGVVAVLVQAIREGGTTINDFADGAGIAGEFQVSLRVYDREGESCPRCRTPIRRIVMSNRSTYYCPRCQR
jgi:formamidopyrimidine-DNA glycosylase